MRTIVVLMCSAVLLSPGCQRKDPRASALGSPPSGAAQGNEEGGASGVVRSGGGAGGASLANRVHKEKALLQLKQLHLAYFNCIASNGRPPQSEDDLKAVLENGDRLLKSPRDGKPFVFAFGVDPAKLDTPASETLLIWESTADSDGHRCALTAAGIPVQLSEAEFQKKIRPKK